MAKASLAARKPTEIESFAKRKIDLDKAKPELPTKKLRSLIKLPIAFPFVQIERLTPTKTIGRGRTNLTLIAPTIFQTDAAVPHASFDLRTQTRRPAAQMHCQPSGYGITGIGTYIMEFTIETVGQATFNLEGGPVGLNILNAGPKTLNGRATVALVFKDLAASAEVFGFVEQTSGTRWNWFSISVRLPDIVLTQA